MSLDATTMAGQRHDPQPRWRLSPRELILIFVFWTSLAALSAANRYLDPRGFGLRGISPVGPMAQPFIEAWLWVALTPVIFWLGNRYSLHQRRWFIRVPLLLIAGILIAASVDVILELVRFQLFELPRRQPASFAPLRSLGRFRFLNQLLVYFAVLAAGFAREYFVRDQQRQQESVRFQAEAARLQAQLAEAQLDALRMQINPHFLFNTLHAISALVERDPSGVRRMIARLSELLRQTLERGGAEEVALRDELSFLRRYLDIMEIRFQGKLQVRMAVDDDALEALVPNFILQPIVENALEHGASKAAGAGEIEIAARRDGDDLVLHVRDNGPGLDTFEDEGVGLRNTRARLGALYGEDSGLSLRHAAEGGVIAEIRLPYHTKNDLRAEEVMELA